ncbi:MAG: histidine phosphatase family protein [Anaerolineae bacterium]
MHATLVDLIRRGEPRGGRRYRGNGADDPLSVEGWRQMHAALGDERPWQQIVTSPMACCRELDSELAGRHGLPIAVEHALAEVGLGAREGRTHAEVAASEPAACSASYRDPVRSRPKGGEPLAELSRWVTAAYARQVESHPDRHLLIVCHAGVMRGPGGTPAGGGARALVSAADRLRRNPAGAPRASRTLSGVRQRPLPPVIALRRP